MMNGLVYLVECVVMCLFFGMAVLEMQVNNPVSFVLDYPPEIQKRYFESQGIEPSEKQIKRSTVIRKVSAIAISLIVFAWLAHLAGAKSFIDALAMVYGYIFILIAFDTIFLDWILFANMTNIRLPGTEDMDEAYHQKWFHVKSCIPFIPAFLVAGLVIAWITIIVW